MIKKGLIVFGLFLIFASGVWLTRQYYHAREAKVEEQSQVLLEKIKTVTKLVTVEGYFSEVYNYKDYWAYDFSLFRKKALVRVKAKVSVGYDLTKMTLESSIPEKTIYISNIPAPSIISIDHTLDYYDISEGTFNSFKPEDYNKINQNAKDFIKEQAEKSDLLKAAETQGAQLLEVIKFIVQSAGWKVKVKANVAVLPN